jgi:hypothetical protein
MVRRHRRFELLDVTIDDRPVGNATVDAWEDDGGTDRWLARILMKVAHGSTDGLLTGSTRDGRRLAGRVEVGMDELGPKGRTVVVDLRGKGPLEDVTEARRH